MPYSFYSILLVLFSIAIIACHKNTEIDKDAVLFTSLSPADTLFFDTVYAGKQAPVKTFKVYNYNSYPLSLSVNMAGQSGYFMNINGVNAKSFKAISLPKNDSLYVFVSFLAGDTIPSQATEMVDSLGIYYHAQKINIVLHTVCIKSP